MTDSIKLLQGKYSDKKCFIIANGPSLLNYDLNKITDDYLVIGVNKAFLAPVKLDYLIYADHKAHEFITENQNWYGDKKPKTITYNSLQVPCDYHFTWEDIPQGITTAQFAISIADQIFNCKEIYLLGYDFTIAFGAHFFTGTQEHFNKQEIINYEFVLGEMVKIIKTNLICKNRIFNCNKSSKLDIFLYKDFNSIF